MTFEKVKRSAEIRGIWIERKKWLNSTVGYGYAISYPEGGFTLTNNLELAYKCIKRRPRIKNGS